MGVWLVCVTLALVWLCARGQVTVERVTGPEIAGQPLLPRRRVINGERAALGDVPYLISFRLKSYIAYTAFCGGSLITQSRIISAAHCFEDFARLCSNGHVNQRQLRGVRAVAGSVTNQESLSRPVSSHTQVRDLRNAWYPNSYKFPKNDIALVTVKTPFHMTAYVRPINYTRIHRWYRGTCLASGFGRTSYHRTQPTKFMFMANLAIMDDYRCEKKASRKTRHFICTDTLQNDVAQGDSGGPLVCRGTGDPGEHPSLGILVGATSCGITSNPKGRNMRMERLTLFTRVSSHAGFIASAPAPPPPAPSPLLLLPALLALFTSTQ